MQRLRGESGATAVIVALLMIPLFGFAAISIDVGGLYFERRQLQNGADAAALAIAQDCAKGVCGDINATASDLAGKNANDNAANATATTSGNTVTVTASTKNPDGSTGLRHFFAPVLGVDATQVKAAATAAWGAPSSGPAVLPITFGQCVFAGKMNVQQLIRYDSNGADSNCTNPSIPGGFGWLAHPGQCSVYDVAVDFAALAVDPGADPPTDCAELFAKFKSDIGLGKNVIVILPVYDTTTGTGSSGSYKIMGFAAFQITGWQFSGSTEWKFRSTCPDGNCRGVDGFFTKFVSLEDFKLGGPAGYDASVVKLMLN